MSLKVDIKKKVGNFLLEAAFEIDKGTLAILGASGSGKSMTLKCIAGIETPDTGKIILDNQILFDSEKKINVSPQERKIGYLFQNYALFPNMTVEENIGVALRMGKAQKSEIVQDNIRKFYLEGLEKKKPPQLSGGQQQRVALARMLVSSPKMIMLDEPFSALDSHLRWKLEQEMQEIIENYQKPALFVSHNRDEVYRISDMIGIMNNGKLEKLSEKRRMFEEPELKSAAILTGCKNFSRFVKIDDYKVRAIDWQVELQTKERVIEKTGYVGIRAHHICVVQDSLQQQNSNTLLCKVVKIIDNTFSVIVMLKNVKQEETQQEENSYENYSEIRLEIGKQEWEEVKGEQIQIKLNKENLLLLR